MFRYILQFEKNIFSNLRQIYLAIWDKSSEFWIFVKHLGSTPVYSFILNLPGAQFTWQWTLTKKCHVCLHICKKADFSNNFIIDWTLKESFSYRKSKQRPFVGVGLTRTSQNHAKLSNIPLWIILYFAQFSIFKKNDNLSIYTMSRVDL